ncbi:MAG TPA: hypothetical protein VGG48_00045 [Rhizomicrobium sp.]|jgi:hypothetical protein
MAKARKTLRAMQDVALDMEEPMRDAIDIVGAIDLMGHGMIGQGNDDHGRPLATLSVLALDKLQFVRESWLKMVKSGK